MSTAPQAPRLVLGDYGPRLFVGEHEITNAISDHGIALSSYGGEWMVTVKMAVKFGGEA